jgi:hypothetical protein
MTHLIQRSLRLALVTIAASCGGTSVTPTTQFPVTAGSPPITVTLSGATLAEDCGSATSTTSSTPPSSIGRGAGSCTSTATDCGCVQSMLMLNVVAGAGQGNLSFAIEKVTVVDDQDASITSMLTTRAPQTFANNVYAPWTEVIAPNANLSVSYSMTAPDWSSLGLATTYSATYRIDVVVSVGGVARTVSLDGVSREAPIST